MVYRSFHQCDVSPPPPLPHSLSESSGDPLSYSTLKLFNLLLAQGKEPPSVSMDFVLCSSVSLIEVTLHESSLATNIICVLDMFICNCTLYYYSYACTFT